MNEKTETVPWWFTDIGDEEIDAITNAIRLRRIQCGTVCAKLERQLAQHLDVPHVVTSASGSAALAMALLACGVEPGDEVIIPAATFIATAHACLLIGARVRLVDVLPERPLIDPGCIEAAVTGKTSAIIPVHLNGAICDMEAILAVAERHGLKVIEDAAQAFASRSARGYAGTQGDAGAFSMSIAKMIATGEGGFVAVRNEQTYERLLRLRNQGILSFSTNVFDEFGFNFRLTDVLAAIGLAQVEKLPRSIEAIRHLHSFYEQELADLDYLKLLESRPDEGELPLWAIVLCSDRDRVVALLEERGIQTRAVNPCLGDSPHLAANGKYPNAERFAAMGLRLPCGPDQSQENLERTVEALHDIAGDM